MADSTIKTSFAGGELSPALYARVDLDKFQVGLATCRNFYVDFRGGAASRGGTRFVSRANAQVPGPKHVVRFVVSTAAAYVLEFGNLYIRYFFNGAPVVDASKAIAGITQANPGVVNAVAHGYTSGNEIYIASVGGMTQINGGPYLVVVIDADHFSLTTIDGVPVNTTGYTAYTAGGTAARVTQTTTPYLAADLFKLKFTQSADTMTITHQSYPPMELKRLTANTFSFLSVETGPVINPPTNTFAAATGSITDKLYGYRITSMSYDGKEESLPSVPANALSEVLDPTKNYAIKITWDAPAGQATLRYNIYKWGPIPNGQMGQSAWGFIGEAKTTQFIDNNIAPDFTRQPPDFYDPFAPGQIEEISVISSGSGLSTTDPLYYPITITGDGTGAEGVALRDGTGIGDAFISIPGIGYTNATGVVGSTGATFSFMFSDNVPVNPGCATYFQQRLCYAGFSTKPTSFIGSQTGLYHNFDTTPTALATDAISINIASLEVNEIKSMVPMSTGLVVFTSGGAFLISGGSPQQAISPSNIVAQAQASTGANDLPPIVINYDILFMQSRGTVVRDLAFNFYLQSYNGTDRSTLAYHLFEGFDITDWAYAAEPLKIVYAVRNDGVLLTLTYVPEQEVYAWARHDTSGVFESVCSIPEGREDAVYFLVSRYLNGAWRQCIERLQGTRPIYVQDAWCVDCGIALPQVYPNATLTPGAATGTGVPFTTDSAVFSAGDVGKVIWLGGGRATVKGYVSTTHVTCDIDVDLTTVTAVGDGLSMPIPQKAGTWTLDTPVTTISGLTHLAGRTDVSVLADGLAYIGRTVDANGNLVGSLDVPSTKVVVGLQYQAQLQTLDLEVNGAATMQGKRKKIPAVTARLLRTRGLKAGPRFDRLRPMKDLASRAAFPNPLFTGDLRIILESAWTEDGQLCFQQDYPLPATILGLMPEVQVGDNAQ